ncbi:MAG: phosphoribosyltransferase family protein [Patescibacteria group bacterium]|jgi:glutamine phosphoribosylpyrophosphate amidotransferase
MRIFGIVAEPGIDIWLDIIVALSLQGYAGPRGCGFGLRTKAGLQLWHSALVAAQAFARMSASEISGYVGNIGIGCNSTTGVMMPIRFSNLSGDDILVVIDSNVQTAKDVVEQMERGTTLRDSVEIAMRNVVGHFALVAMSNDDEIVCGRNSGLMPLSISKIVGDHGVEAMYVSSSSRVLNRGVSFVRSVMPGEIAVLSCNGFIAEGINIIENLGCPLEGLFHLPPGDQFGGIGVQDIRYATGRALGHNVLRDRPEIIDKNCVVIAIPDGGNKVAEGLAYQLGVKFLSNLAVKNRYPDNKGIKNLTIRGVAISSKYTLAGAIPIRLPGVEMFNEMLNGKNVFLVDDSFYSGWTFEHFLYLCKEAGADKVHGFAPTIAGSPCSYGKDAHREGSKARDHTGQIDQIARDIGLDSFTTLSRRELIGAINTPQKILCTECLCFSPQLD